MGLTKLQTSERCAKTFASDPILGVILTISTGSFIYCRPNSDKRIERNYKVGDEDVRIEQVCCCIGKAHAYTLNHKLGIISIEVDPAIAWLEAEVPKVPPLLCAFSYSLVESCGDILLVRSSHLSVISHIVEFEVYKMNVGMMIWEEVHSLGDVVIFIGDRSSASCSATDLGIEGNHIFLAKENDRSLCIYSMDRGTIYVDLPCPNVHPPWQLADSFLGNSSLFH
ncbi:hypothetical protein ACLOJK_016702 [Asimina triloba]